MDAANAQIAAMAANIAQLEADLRAATVAAAAGQPALQTNRHLKPSKPETFLGTSSQTDVGGWLFQLHQYLTIVGLADEVQAIQFASTFLRGPAAVWWRSQVEAVAGLAPFATWVLFSDALKQQFQPVNVERAARDRLAGLVQQRSVQDYVTHFRTLCLQIRGISADEKLDRFIRGLKPAVQREVQIRDPTTFDIAIQVAERIDAVEYRMRQQLPSVQRTFPPRFTASSVPPRLVPGSSYSAPAPSPTPMELGALRRGPLTLNEREKLRQNGGCFYCRKLGHILPNCPERASRTTVSLATTNLSEEVPVLSTVSENATSQ